MPGRFWLTAFVLLPACNPSAPTVRLDEAFVLARGEAARLDGTGLNTRFVAVKGDSRCPADVVCIQSKTIEPDEYRATFQVTD